MAEIDDLLKSIDDVLANENLQTEEEKPDENQDLINQIDAAIEPPKQEAQVKEELPKATPSRLPSPAATPEKEPEIDLSKPSNQVLSIIGDKDQEDFDAADLELIDGLEDGKDLYEFSKARPDISLKTDQARKIFEYQRTNKLDAKVPQNPFDWYNLTGVAEDVGDVLKTTGEVIWGGLKGAGKMIQYGTPSLLGKDSTYSQALALEKMLAPEKRQEVEAWRKRAWQIASTPLKGGEQPSPEAYTDEKYLQKVKENLPPEKAQEAQKTEQEFQEKRYKAKQVPYSYFDELAGLPIKLGFMGTKVGVGGMQTWDDVSEKFGIQDKEKSFDNWLARNEIDTAQAKMIKAEPRAFARVVQTYYAPAMKSFTNLLHPSVEEYMIMYPELSREEAQAKRAEQIDSDVQTTIEDIKKDIPETDPDIAVWGGLSTPSQFGLDEFGFAFNVLSASKQLTPLIRARLRQMRYTDDQINTFEKQAQQALRAKELKRLEKLEKPGLVERAAGATARGIEKVGDYIERSPTMQKIGKALPVASGAMLGYQIDPENPLQSLAVGSLGGAVGIPVARQTLKTITEIPKSIKEISAARRISAGGAQGPLATLKTIAQQQDEVKMLSAKLKTYAEGTDDFIETEKLLKDAKDKLKGIKAGGTDVIDYQGIGKVSDTTKRILRFVNDDMISNIGEYAKLGVEPTLVGLATGIIDSSDEDELKSMIGQGLAFSLGGRAVQQSFNKFIGEDPVIAARKSRQTNVDAFKAYRDSSPETRGEIDQLTDWDNVINRQATKAEQAQIALQELQAKGADPAKIAEAQKAATAEQKSLSLLKTANVQTRNEFGRQFLQQLGRNNMLLNGSLKAGQNNVGFHILSTQQIFDHFRKNPAFANVPDDVILTYAGQSGFYSGGGQQGENNMAFDPAKPAIVLNSDALRNRMEVFGETPIDALNHETGHHISRVPEIQDALGDVRKILFTNEIKDASGLTKTITNGLYTNDQLVDLFDSQYLKNKSKQEKEQIAKSLGLWDSGLNQLDRENVKNYMQEEILAEVFSNTLSRNLGKNIDDKQIHLLDFARLKLKNNLLKKAAVKMLGLGMDGNVESAVTGAQITPEAQSAARNALRIMQSMNGDFSTITSQPDVPAISKADIKKSRVAAERYGMDSGLFETKTIAQVFDAAGKPIGDAIEITDPAVFEGSWRIGKDGEERLSGYGQVPVELRQLQVPEGGTLSISKQLQTEADGVTPKMLEKGELAKRIKNRAELFKKAIDTPDYGTPGRFEPVYEGSETYRGSFTPMQIQAIKDLPEGIVPLKIKKYLLELNDAIVRKDGTRFFVDYAAVMDDKGNYKAFSPKIYDVVPIGLQLSSAGNFLVTTISVGRMREKLNLWADRMPGRLSPWNGSKEAFWQDFSKKYLANWAAQIEGSGYKNGVPVGNNQLDPDYQKAEEKKSILNDYLYLFTEATRPLNLDRTEIPRRKGDPKNKSLDRTIMSMRIDHFAELLSGEHLPKLPINYGKAIINFFPAPSVEVEAPSGERGFKSKLQTEIQSKFKGANATPEQLKAVVGNPQFVKPEEVKWSGVMDEIDRLAQENKGKVPVQALVNYLRDEGQVKFEEVTLGSTGNNAEKIAEKYGIRIDAEYGETAFYKENDGLLDELEFDELPEELRNELNKVIPKSTAKFAGYQLPGGENYREVVLTTAPKKDQPKVVPHPDKNLGGFALQYSDGSYAGGDRPYQWRTKLAATEGVQKYKDEYGDIGFTSSHFPDVPNYIAHMRVNERTDVEGNEGIFVEEFQSDRHQKGREQGYGTQFAVVEPRPLMEGGGTKEVQLFESFDEAQSFILENRSSLNKYKVEEKTGISDAPFRKDWGVQLFKRALRDAVESGKSWIGWTTGIEQIKRYEETLRQQVKSIEWTTEDGLTIVDVQPTKGKRIYLPVKNGKIYRTADQQSLVGKDLAEVIGKEATAKVNESSSGKLTGDDLTIGGEGMKGFYDQILPKEIGKYVAKMGGKVEKSEIESGESKFPSWDKWHMQTYGQEVDATLDDAIINARYAEWEKLRDTPQTVLIWRVNITPEMENIVRAGQIQFMPADAEGAMPAEQPQGMAGVEAPQTYRRISGMIPPLQGVELPEAIAKGAGEFGILRQALQGVEAPIREAAKTPEIPKQQVEVKQEIPVAKVEADAEEEVADTELRSTGIEVPESVDEQSVISNAIKVANSQPWKKGRDFKMDLQRRVMEAAEKAGVTISERTAEAIEYLARVGFKDALIALEQNPNAIGWYDEKTKQALGVMSLLFPEIATDENARFAFTWALAVTSNGLKVDKNFELAERVYRQYRKSGKMPTNIEAGQAQKAINEGLDLFNKLTKEWGMENTRKFMQTDFTVGEISRLSKDLSPGGEFSDTNVRGSAILGPKIGNGFFSNLYGLFDALTMDRWLVRTWGRWTGTLVELNPELTKQATNRLQEAVQKLTPEDKARMDKIIKQDISQMSLEDLSVAIQKASMKPELRQLMNQTETGEEFRKSGNGLAKYLDGQKEAPSGPTERNFIREIFGLMLDELKSDPKYAGLTMADLQAVLWYAEKRLYETAKVKADQDNLDSSDADGYEDDEAPDYANAAIGVAREKGISQKRIDEVLEKIKNDRTTTTRPETQEGDSDQARQQEGAGGFVGKEKQKFQQYVAVTTARRNRTGNEKALWSYSRGGGKDSGDAGVLKPKSKKNLGVKYISEWKPGRKLATMFRNNGLPPVKFLELDSTDKASAQKFADTLQKSKDASVNGAAVYVYPVEDYQGMKLFISESGQSGFALKSDGDIVSVFSMDKGSGRSIMETAIAAGGKKLDAFDTILPEFYGTHGFVEAARIPWNDEFAPEGWDKETFKKFNNGEPDVVMMVLDPKFEGEYEPRTDIYATDYDQAVEMQDSLLKKMNKGVKK